MKKWTKKLSPKIISRITLIILMILFFVKLINGTCNIWFCMLFVGVIVAYAILSDYFGDD